MAIRRSSAPQTAALVQDLVGDDAVRREAAVARLAIAGARAVDPLLRALPDAAPTGRAAILRALELIAEPRALPASLAHVDSPDAAVGIAAIGAVRPHLQSDDAARAAEILDVLTAVALDASRPEAVRVAALGALSDLGEAMIGPLRTRLAAEERPRVRRAAGLEGPIEADDELAAARLEAVVGAREDDPELVQRLAREAGAHVTLSALHELVLYLRERERTAPAAARPRWEAARGAAHLALGERGSRLAVFDLREALVEVAAVRLADFVRAARLVGDPSCLEGLATAWQGAGAGELRELLADAFCSIVKREGLTKRHSALKRVLTLVPASTSLLA